MGECATAASSGGVRILAIVVGARLRWATGRMDAHRALGGRSGGGTLAARRRAGQSTGADDVDVGAGVDVVDVDVVVDVVLATLLPGDGGGRAGKMGGGRRRRRRRRAQLPIKAQVSMCGRTDVWKDAIERQRQRQKRDRARGGRGLWRCSVLCWPGCAGQDACWGLLVVVVVFLAGRRGEGTISRRCGAGSGSRLFTLRPAPSGRDEGNLALVLAARHCACVRLCI